MENIKPNPRFWGANTARAQFFGTEERHMEADFDFEPALLLPVGTRLGLEAREMGAQY